MQPVISFSAILFYLLPDFFSLSQEKVEKNREGEADEDGCCEGEVKGKAISFNQKVTRKAADKGDFGRKGKQCSNNDEDDAKE